MVFIPTLILGSIFLLYGLIGIKLMFSSSPKDERLLFFYYLWIPKDFSKGIIKTYISGKAIMSTLMGLAFIALSFMD